MRQGVHKRSIEALEVLETPMADNCPKQIGVPRVYGSCGGGSRSLVWFGAVRGLAGGRLREPSSPRPRAWFAERFPFLRRACEARRFRQGRRQIGKDDAVYSTAKDQNKCSDLCQMQCSSIDAVGVLSEAGGRKPIHSGSVGRL